MSWLKRHFKNYRNRKPWRFCWQITIEGFLVVVPFAFLLLVLDGGERSDLQNVIDESVVEVLLISGVLFPILETLVLQAFPVFVAKLFRASFLVQILAAWIPFAILHFFAGISVGICAGVIRGFYFSFTYTHWRQISRWKAFWITSISHVLNNLVLLSLILIVAFLIKNN